MHSRQSFSSTIPDEELLELFNQGRRSAFDELVCRYKSRLFGFIYIQIHQQAEDAEDLTQEVFVQLYQTACNFKGESQFSSYLFGIAKNLILNYFRTQSRRPKVVDSSLGNSEKIKHYVDSSAQQTPTNTKFDKNTPDAVSELLHNQNALNNAIKQLTNEERQLLFLHDKENFTYDQISVILNLKIGTIRSRLHNTRKKLMTILKRVT